MRCFASSNHGSNASDRVAGEETFGTARIATYLIRKTAIKKLAATTYPVVARYVIGFNIIEDVARHLRRQCATVRCLFYILEDNDTAIRLIFYIREDDDPNVCLLIHLRRRWLCCHSPPLLYSRRWHHQPEYRSSVIVHLLTWVSFGLEVWNWANQHWFAQ